MSTQILRLKLGSLDTNCYFVWCSETKEALIIDPADSGDVISEKILELELKPVAIVLTHGHFDHIIGLLEVKLNFPVPIIMHQADEFLVTSLQKRAQHWLRRQVDPAPPADKFVDEGDIIKFGQQELKILHTPGHTPGGICLYNHQIIITGDTLFKNAVGRTDLSYSNPTALEKSLKKIFQLSDKLVVYPGHGHETTIEDEKKS